jgi:hypothetical protein
MSQKNVARHRVICQITAQTTVKAEASNVPMQNKKEDAKQTLYLNRV